MIGTGIVYVLLLPKQDVGVTEGLGGADASAPQVVAVADLQEQPAATKFTYGCHVRGIGAALQGGRGCRGHAMLWLQGGANRPKKEAQGRGRGGGRLTSVEGWPSSWARQPLCLTSLLARSKPDPLLRSRMVKSQAFPAGLPSRQAFRS